MYIQCNNTMVINNEVLTPKSIHRLYPLLTMIIVIFIPTYSNTHTVTRNGRIRERSFQWPWMIITRYTPNSEYNADQLDVVAFPWSFILFMPFLYVLYQSWEMYISPKFEVMRSIKIILAAFGQGLILYMVSKSQDMDEVISESVTIYYVPHILVILIHGTLLYRLRN